MTDSAIENHPVFASQWYHTLELAPGVVTNGRSFDNLAVTRLLLNGVSAQGVTCLDIGAMDGLLTFLLERRGAARPVAYDRNAKPKNPISNGDRFRFACQQLGSKAEFLWDMPISGILPASQQIGIRAYDLIVFSGVLYHMFDPLSGLAMVRNLLREGGLLVLETGAILDGQQAMYANAAGRFYPADDYWLPSVATLDYWLRFLRLEVLDVCHLRHRTVDGLPVVRAGLVARATASFHALPDDQWMPMQNQGLFDADFREWVQFDELKSAATPVPYQPMAELFCHHPGSAYIDAAATMMSRGALQPEAIRHLLSLQLADR